MDSIHHNALLRLRAVEPSDLDALYRWENEQEIWTYGTLHQPVSRESLRQYIADSIVGDIYSQHQLRLMGENAEGTLVGCVDLFDFDAYHHRAAVGIVVDGALRHRGYGTALLAALHSYAVAHLQLHQLYSIVAADNEASMQLFQGAGYDCCGHLKDYIWDGTRWQDAVMLQHLFQDR